MFICYHVFIICSLSVSYSVKLISDNFNYDLFSITGCYEGKKTEKYSAFCFLTSQFFKFFFSQKMKLMGFNGNNKNCVTFPDILPK